MRLWLGLLLAASLSGRETYTYWIQPCSKQLSEDSGCEVADEELARWALEAWQRAGQGALSFTPAPEQSRARLRVYWARGRQDVYGEARPIIVDGRTGAAIHVRPVIALAGGTDNLLRDAIVYLTCLHETGHAIGLPHTANFKDIMYSFGYGGDIREYFMRYRQKLESREQIRRESGMSPSDQKQLRSLYSGN